MPTYRYQYNGPRDSEIAGECGIELVSNPIEPALTKDYEISAQDEPVLTEALGFRGWVSLGEVTP